MVLGEDSLSDEASEKDLDGPWENGDGRLGVGGIEAAIGGAE
jgi:hypothetical protein